MGERIVRGIAVGNRINVAAWRDDASAQAEIARIVGLAVPHLAADLPNVIVLGELLGLPGALLGRGGALARRQRTARGALMALAVACLLDVLVMRRRWHGISLVRALLMARTDALFRPLAVALPHLARQHNATIVAGTVAPEVIRSTDARALRRWGQPGASEVYLPTGPDVYNCALLATPDGVIHRVNKVFPTESERATLDVAAGRLADVQVVATPAGRVGIAISLDAFTPDYLRQLDALGAEIVLQPDANDQLWAAPSKTCEWQPQEWLNAVLGSVQDDYPHLHANICAMQTGNFFDVTFDGQSSITQAGPDIPNPVDNFVGNDGFIHTVTGRQMTGSMLAVAPWVVPDPILRDPSLAVAARRQALHAAGLRLLPGAPRAGQFREVAISADIVLRG